MRKLAKTRWAATIRQLVLAKRAIYTVTKRMQKEDLVAQATEVDDKLGWTMSNIRAAETVNLHRMAHCARAYPYSTTFVNPNDPNARGHPSFATLRLHAVELARSSITEKITQLKSLDVDDQNSPRRRQAKEHILVSLKRRLPGSTTTLHAMETEDNSVTTDPTEVAKALQRHLGQSV